MGAVRKTGWESFRRGRSHPHQLFRKGCGKFLCSILLLVTTAASVSRGSCPVFSNPQGNYYQPSVTSKETEAWRDRLLPHDPSGLGVGAGFEREPFLATSLTCLHVSLTRSDLQPHTYSCMKTYPPVHAHGPAPFTDTQRCTQGLFLSFPHRVCLFFTQP